MTTEKFNNFTAEQLEQAANEYGNTNSNTLRARLIREGMMTKQDKLKDIIAEIREEIEARKAKIEKIEEEKDEEPAPTADIEPLTDKKDMSTHPDLTALIDEIAAEIEEEDDKEEDEEANTFDKFKDEETSFGTLPHRFFESFGRKFYKADTQQITDNTKCVEVIIPGAKSRTKIGLETFNNVFKAYAIEKLPYQSEEARKARHEQYPAEHRPPYINDVMMLRVPVDLRGIRYLDIDHLNVSNVEELIATIQPIITKLSSLPCYILTFLPEDINKRIKKHDAGAHTYIIYNPEDIDDEKWKETTDYLTETLRDSFDPNPWKSSSINLPFCHKSYTSANYYLNLPLCYPSTIEEIQQSIENSQFVAEAMTSKQIEDDKNKQPKFFAGSNGKGLNARGGEIEAIAEGFKGITIHRTQQGSIKDDHLGVLVIASAINSIANEEEREKLSQLIYEKANVSSNASDVWDLTFERAQPTWIGVLWNIIKIHNPSYYVETYPQFERKTFQNSEYNIKNFQRDTFETFPQIMEKLSLCVAINLEGGIIVKNDDGYKVMARPEFLSIYDRQFTLKMTEEEQEEANKKAEEQHKKKSDGKKTITLANIIRSHNYCQQLSSFDNVKVASSNPKVLNLYIPPALTDMNQGLVGRFIRYFMRHAKYTHPLLEYFHSVAFKLRHPDVLIQKFFIFHGQRHDGKSFLVGAVKQIFNKFGWIVRESDLTSDNFNAWQEKALMIWMEEVENISRKGKLEELVRILTTRDTARRGMHKDLTQGQNNALVGFNTNDETLSGLCRTIPAVLERLVIVEYNEPTEESKKEVDEISDLTELLSNPEGETAKSFIFTLYSYFLKQHELPEKFNIVRYSSPEKDEIIKEKQVANASFVESWIIEENKKLVKKGYIKKVPTAYISIKEARASYKSWIEETQNTRAKVKWEQELKLLGWKDGTNDISGHKERVMMMNWDNWKKWIHEREGESVEISSFIDDSEDTE